MRLSSGSDNLIGGIATMKLINVGDDDSAAASRECQRRSTTNARRRASDGGHLSGKPAQFQTPKFGFMS